MTEENRKVQEEILEEAVADEQEAAKADNKPECSEEAEKSSVPEENSEEEKASEDGDDEDKFIRLMADFQNFKKRAAKEKSDIYAYANEKIALDMLNVIDNFERALNQGSSDESFAEGMSLIFKQIMDALVKAGLEEIKAQGEEFDPNLHNAVMMCDDEGFESGHVTEVLQKGYKLNGKLLRAAMVKVKN